MKIMQIRFLHLPDHMKDPKFLDKDMARLFIDIYELAGRSWSMNGLGLIREGVSMSMRKSLIERGMINNLMNWEHISNHDSISQ